jgi:EAL domain-containing protein (putative c-di-GMP-specific phosphodiesterase class I)
MTETDSRDGARMGLSHVVELTRRHLDLDVAFIVELAEESRQVYRAVAGDAAAFGIVVGEDALATARAARVETCVEVPMLLSDGGRYGTLCGLSRAARPDLGTRDTDFMSMLGEVIIEELDALREQQQLYTAILRLIETEDLKVAYQPIIDLRSGQCLGVEALARFPKPFTRPDVTLAAATRLGLGLELERLVIREAWKTLPKLGPGQYLALNVSPHVLVELARRANLRDDLPLSQLVVEVTEHSVVDCYAPLLDELAPLRERGLRIAVDDAGAGYASLRHVLELRPDIVKVDRSLIHGIAGDHAQRVAVGAFLSLATQLRACVVAEGVERHSDPLAA